MAFSREVLASIVRRASTPPERLSPPFTAGSPNKSADLVATWRRLVAKDDETRFATRLEMAGWDETDAGLAFAEQRFEPDAPVPVWASALDEAVGFARARAAEGFDALEGDPCLEGREPIPFMHLMVPLVGWARERVAEAARGLPLGVDAAALVNAEHWLLQELARLHAGALFEEFRAARAAGQGSFAEGGVGQEEDTALYRDFAAGWLRADAPEFYAVYPVLARLAGTVLLNWVGALGELLLRLADDRSAIQASFPELDCPTRLVGLEFGLSDRHFGGRVVARASLDSGHVLAYKPKPIGLEVAVWGFVAWLNREGAPVTLKELRVVARPTHGWVEWAEPASCEGEPAAGRYYERAGALLCIAHWLYATDCHYENLVACGEHPVLVDAEAYLHPHRRLPDGVGVDRSASYEAERVINESVLGTGFLPRWIIYADGSSYDLSGLGTTPGATMPFSVTEWVAINTDAMARSERQGRSPGRKLGPRVGGVLVSPSRYSDNLVAGFEQMYRFGMHRRDAFLAAGGPLRAFSGLSSRYILRPTVAYGVLTDWLHRPSAQRDGAQAWTRIDLLSSDLLDPNATHLRPVLADETAALMRFDVPWFGAPVDGDALVSESGLQVPRCFAEPSLHAALRRVREASEETLSLQSYLIRSSLLAFERTTVHAGNESSPAVAADEHSAPRRIRDGAVDASMLIGAAEEIGRRLADQSIRGQRGRLSWIALVFRRDGGRFQLQPTDLSLYEGSTGIALFLAALHRATGDAVWKDLARGALVELMEACATRPLDTLVRSAGQIGPAGLGNVIYGLASVSEFLDDPAPMESALTLARRLEEVDAREDAALDVLFGSAGMVLGLLRLLERSGEPWLRDRAAVFGRKLVAASVPGPLGGRAWPSEYGRSLTGFSHGAAGMAYALLRLSAEVPDASFTTTATEAIAFEKSLFLPGESNWPDLRYPPDSGRRGMSWCHGAPGIALARIGALDLLDTPAVRADVAAALSAAAAAPRRDADHLCCGTLGLAELNLCCGRSLGDPEWAMRGMEMAGRVLAEAGRRGRYRLAASEGAHADGCYPGLFQGEAGVGYSMLRFSDPRSFPSLLLFR